MIDYSYNATIQKHVIDISAGKNILTSITDQGILRIFFTDNIGNLYGSIVKRSNFKQIVNDSSNNRSKMNNERMSQQYYGAPFLVKKYRYKHTFTDESGTLVEENTHIGNFNINWRHDAFLDNKRGNSNSSSTSDSDGLNINGAGYDKKGYSTGADIWYDNEHGGEAEGENGEVPDDIENTPTHFTNQRIPNTFWDCVGEGFYFDNDKNGGDNQPRLRNFRINSPDVYRFINAEENLTYSISGNSSSSPPNDINSHPTLDYKYPYIRTSTSPVAEVRNIDVGSKSYFQVCRRPSRRMIIQDMGGGNKFQEANATKYPQGFILYADNAEDNAPVGELKIRALFENTEQNYFDGTRDDAITNKIDLDNAYCDLDLDISATVANGFRLYLNFGPSGNTMIDYKDTLSRAFFIYEYKNASLPQLNIGSLTPINYATNQTVTRRYDYSSNLLSPINISGGSYCKIKCDKKTDWGNKKIHIVYKKSPKCIRYERYYISGFMEPVENTDTSINGAAYIDNSYNIDCSDCGWCSMDLDNLNNPHIAFFDIGDNNNTSRINYIWNDNSGNDENIYWKCPTDRPAYIINNNVGNYFELSNNPNENFLSLACSPYDGSVHISYYTELSGIQYWTNSQYTPHAIKDPSNKTIFSALAYGKKLVNNKLRNPYVDLSWNMDISNIYLPLYSIDTPYPHITSPKRKISVRHSKKNGKDQLNANLCDIIYINTTVETPKIFDASKTIFLIGGTNGNEGTSNGKKGAYIGGVTDNSKIYFGINGINNTLSITSKELSGNKIYHLTFYYNKYDREAKITISGGIYDNLSESFTDISKNGGYNMLDGYLTIGSSSHVNDTTNWTTGDYKNSYIKRISIYNTDISNITFYDISRENRNIITSWPHTQYIDYSGHNVSNADFITRKVYSYSISGSNEYNKIQKKQGIKTYEKNVELHELFYIQRIKQQPDKEDGIEIIARSMDIYHTGTGNRKYNESIIWVVGGKEEETEDETNPITGYILVSNNGGESWVENKKHPLYDSIIEFSDLKHNKDNAQYYSVKLFEDNNSNKWAWLAGNNYGLYYCVANNWEDLGTKKNNWKIIGDISGYGARDTRYPTITKRTLNYVYPVKCNDTDSENIFGSPPSNGDFHVWVGGNHNKDNHVDPSSGAFDMVLRGNKDKFNQLDILLNIGVDNIELLPDNLYTSKDADDGTPVTYVLNKSMFPDICRNIIWTDISKQKTKNTELYNIKFDNNGKYGIIGGKNNIFVTNNGGSSWESRLDSSENDVEVMGSYVDFDKNNNELFSVVTNSVPWLGPGHDDDSFPVVSTARFDDQSFNLINKYPNKNGTWDPSYNKGGYWDVASLPYDITGGISKYAYDRKSNNVYKTNNFTGISNNWVIGYNNNEEYTIFNKNTITETWMRHDLNTVTDISGNIQSMAVIDNCGVLLFVDGGGGSNGGIYKLSVEPPIPNLVLEWPMVIRAQDNKTDDFRSKLTFKGFEKIDISNNIKYELWEASGNILNDYEQVDKDFNPSKPTANKYLKPDPKFGPGFHTDGSKNTERIYRSHLLYPNIKYNYKARTQNEFGHSFYTAGEEIPITNGIDPKILNSERNIKILRNIVKWKNPSQIYFYDISRSWRWRDPSFSDVSGNEFSGNELLKKDISNTNQTRIIDDISYVDYDISLNFRYIYYLTFKGPQKQEEGQIQLVCNVPHGKPIAVYTKYDYNTNKINIKWENHNIDYETTKVTYDISWSKIKNTNREDGSIIRDLSSSDPNMTDIQSSTIDINSLNYKFDYSGQDLSANYTYKFLIDASYNNKAAAELAGVSGAARKSISSEIFQQRIKAVIPDKFNVNYESPPSGNGDNITINWIKTDTSFNDIHWPGPYNGPTATDISYEISFNNIYHANSFTNFEYGGSDGNIGVIDGDSYIFGDRGFSGNSITKFQVRAIYKYFNSDWTDPSEVTIAKHIPVFTEFITNKNDEPTSNPNGYPVNDVESIKLVWKETTGATQYDISRTASFYHTTDGLSSNTISFVKNIIQSKDGREISYTDTSPPLNDMLKKPRKYKYTIRANYAV